MSIESKLARIQQAKSDIIQAIIDKGVDVPEDVKVEDLAELIAQIEVGPGPSPSYDYVLLQNFTEEHTIGTPDTEPYGVSTDWITTVLSIGGYEQNNMSCDYSYLVDDTEGATLLDNRNFLNFQKYNVSNGTPFGNISSNGDTNWQGMRFTLPNWSYGDNFTFEFFTRGRDGDPEYDFYMTYGLETVARIGSIQRVIASGEVIQDWSLSIEVNSMGGIEGVPKSIQLLIRNSWSDIPNELDSLCEITESSHPEVFNGESMERFLCRWHHYAISKDDNNLYFFIDGHKVFEMALSTNLELTTSDAEFSGTLSEFLTALQPKVLLKPMQMGTERMYDGNYAQLALCNGCKWSSDFTPPTEAY